MISLCRGVYSAEILGSGTEKAVGGIRRREGISPRVLLLFCFKGGIFAGEMLVLFVWGWNYLTLGLLTLSEGG